MSIAGISFVSVSESPSPPPNTICHGKQHSDLDGDGNLNLWSVMANTPHGKIPGFATKDEAYYSFEGQDYTCRDFSWVVSENNTYLVHSNYNANPPSNALMIAYQQHAFPYYFILGYNKNHGMIPGFYNGTKAVYAYGGKEFTAKEFYWIVVDNPGWFVIESKLSGGVLKIDEKTQELKTSKCIGSNNQLWTWRGSSLMNKSGYYLGQPAVGQSPGAKVVALDTRGADMIETKWKIENGKIISGLSGMAVDIKDGSIWTNKDVILWPASQSTRIDSQSWRLVLYHA